MALSSKNYRLAWALTVQLLGPKPAGLPFAEGFDAFCFLGFSAFGLRTSRLDFFWLFAMIFPLKGRLLAQTPDHWLV
jgi:hypothetical protein